MGKTKMLEVVRVQIEKYIAVLSDDKNCSGKQSAVDHLFDFWWSKKCQQMSRTKKSQLLIKYG
jgi:hypothetical protein